MTGEKNVWAGSGSASELPLFSIGVIADLQYADKDNREGRFYRSGLCKLAVAIEHFNKENLAFVIHLGDFIDRDWESFECGLAIWRRLSHASYFVLGNHEFSIPDEMKNDVLSTFGLQARYYNFVCGDWIVIVLDGTDLSTYGWRMGSAEDIQGRFMHANIYPDKPRWNGAIGENQLAWLDERLSWADTNRKRAMLFCHFPVFPVHAYNLWNDTEVLKILARHRSAVIWLNGHNHHGNSGCYSGTYFFTMKSMVDGEDGAYSIIRVYSDRIVLEGFGREQNYNILFNI